MKLKEEIRQLKKSDAEKVNLLTEIEELKTQNLNLKQTKVNLAQQDDINKITELKENHEIEVNEPKTENEELRKKLESSESLTVALGNKIKELVQEI